MSYCIYNKHYTQESWISEVQRLIRHMQGSGEWGEFFDAKHALYPYDASYAMMVMPLEKENAIVRGLEWCDYEHDPEGVTKTIPADRLPYDVTKIPDDVISWAILSRKNKKPYAIQPMELELSRRFHIPLSRIHPIERIQQLFGWDKREFDFDF